MLVKGSDQIIPSSGPQRFNIPGHAHEITFSCFKRKPFLDADTPKLYLVDSINSARLNHNFEVWSYVIMPEHIHILIFPKERIYSISGILRSIKLSSAKKVINRLKKANPDSLKMLETGQHKPKYRFWQDGGGYDRNYWTTKEIINQVEYIHNNPVRRGLVKSPDDYYWSSARFWMRGEVGPIKVERECFPVI